MANSSTEGVRVKSRTKSAKSRGAAVTPITRKARVSKPPHGATIPPIKAASTNAGKRLLSRPSTFK